MCDRNFKPREFLSTERIETVFIEDLEYKNISAIITYDTSENIILIYWHGTITFSEVMDDLNLAETRIELKKGSNIKVHSGFLQYYNRVKPKLKQALRTIISKLNKNNNVIKIVSTGHSLGAAVSTLSSYFYSKHKEDYSIPINAQLYNYAIASPRVGNKSFADDYNNVLDLNTIRIVNEEDNIPKLPPTELGYTHVNSLPDDDALTFSANCGSPALNHLPQCYYDNIKNIDLD